jgi:hypothetical protein
MKITVIVFLSIIASGNIWASKIEQTGTDHCSGWSDQVRELADQSWKYAQLSQNVYANKFNFNMNDEFKIIKEFDRPGISYYAALFKNTKSNEYAFIFRGTDSFQDFKTGNNPFKQTQNKHALKDVRNAIEKYSIKKAIVAGHSLGGGMATHVSLNIDNVLLYTFNGSPVYKQKNDKYKNKRYSIVERGEILKIVRALASEPDQLYTSIECTKGNPVTQHSMEQLAICLTRISAVNNNKESLNSLKANGIDKKWCKGKS